MTSGLFWKCATGSATAQVNMPTPMPAPNIIENQENRVNSGCSPSTPRFMRPAAGQNARIRQTSMKSAMTQMYQAAKISRMVALSPERTAPEETGQTMAQTQSAEMMIFAGTATLVAKPS